MDKTNENLKIWESLKSKTLKLNVEMIFQPIAKKTNEWGNYLS
jgi:hypothetical protein